ncbi:MAG: hypothetical protein DRN95_04235 [Candidatus Hydrothermarchaeota archaeon]|nr:MAG: hypothetical protein DRN95_04235 [Candidatus Hydrothermarchaeota archaeon]
MQSEIKKEKAKEKAKKLYELVGIEEVGVMIRRNKIPEETPFMEVYNTKCRQKNSSVVLKKILF